VQTAPNIDLAKAVKAYGTFTALAKRLNLTLSTVHGWKLRKRIPAWRRREMLAAAKEDGHDIVKKSRRAKKLVG
jgi:hypothetical protein